jgi:hypothetical protein
VTNIRLGVGCERKPECLVFGLASKPLLLFSHRRGVCPEEGKNVEIIVESRIIQLSRMCLVDQVLRLIWGYFVLAEFGVPC